MSTTWILIANSSKAHLYETHKARLFRSNGYDDDSLKLVKDFSHHASRKKAGDLVSDRVGNYSSSGHGSFVEATDPKAYEAQLFARELVETLDSGRISGKFDDVVLVAAPYFRGILQKQLTNPLEKYVSHTIDKDYTQFSGRQLLQQLREQL